MKHWPVNIHFPPSGPEFGLHYAVSEDLSIGRPCLIIDVIAGCWPRLVLIGRS